MKNHLLFILSLLIYSASSETQEASQTLFFGENFQISLPVGGADVSFKPSIGHGREKSLMKNGQVVDVRAKFNTAMSHLILENVGESDEGVYTITSNQNTENVTSMKLYIRDCSTEIMVMYGLEFHFSLNDISEPLRISFRNSSVEANQTSLAPVQLLNADGTPKEIYQDRLEVNPQKKFLLRAVTGADEGSYTFSDSSGKVKKKICLNVKEHQLFPILSYGDTLKINLHLNGSLVRLLYTPDTNKHKYLILENGEITLPSNLDFEDRVSLEESVFVLKNVKPSDAGVFSVMDLQGFLVSIVHLEIKSYMLPNLYIAIIALVALLVLLLLVCLVSCLVKIRKRAAKARAIEEKVQNAGKAEGDAFRQVVKDACTRQNEEAPALSQKEDITEKSQSTEVSIKGLEVSTKEPSLQERNMETSDSGVGFNTTGLPLDSDTDAQTAAIADSDVESSKAVPNQIPEPKTAPSPPKPEPTSDLKPAPVAKSTAPPPPSPEPKPAVTPEPKPAATPEPKPAATPEPKMTISPPPETKPTLSPSPEPKQAVTPDPKPASPAPEAKPIPSPTPEPPKAITPTPDAKPAITPDAKPAVSPTPEPTPAKIDTPVSPTPDPKTPDPKALSPVPELKPTSPTPQSKPPVSPILDSKPTTNGTPESKADIESGPSVPLSPGLDVKVTTPPKTPDTGKSSVKTPELISTGGLDSASTNDSAAPPSADGAATN